MMFRVSVKSVMCCCLKQSGFGVLQSMESGYRVANLLLLLLLLLLQRMFHFFVFSCNLVDFVHIFYISSLHSPLPPRSLSEYCKLKGRGLGKVYLLVFGFLYSSVQRSVIG